MSKKDENLKMINKYLEEQFPGQEIVPSDIKGLMEDRPDQFFYSFQVGGKYLLAVVRATVEEETVFPILEGKQIGEKMRSHPNSYVVLEKGDTGKGPEVKIKEVAS